MDRTFAPGADGSRSMPHKWTVPIELLLPATRRRERRESGVDAFDRQAVPSAALLRVSADDAVAAGSGLSSQSQAHHASYASHGDTSSYAWSPHQQSTSGSSCVPVPSQRAEDRRTGSGMVRRHHLYSDEEGLSVSGGGYGLVQQICSGMGTVEQSGRKILCGSIGPSAGGRAAGDIQHLSACVHAQAGGSGESIYEYGVYGSAATGRGTDQHGRPGPSDGQHHGGAVVVECKIRGGVPSGLWGCAGSAGQSWEVFQFLQHGASASESWPPHAGAGLPVPTRQTGVRKPQLTMCLSACGVPAQAGARLPSPPGKAGKPGKRRETCLPAGRKAQLISP